MARLFFFFPYFSFSFFPVVLSFFESFFFRFLLHVLFFFVFYLFIFLIFHSCSILFRYSFDYYFTFPEMLTTFFCGPFFLRKSINEVRPRLFLNLILLLKLQKEKHTQRLRRASMLSSSMAAQSSEARTCRSECVNATKETELARASMSSNIYMQFAVFPKPTKKSKPHLPI